MKLKVDKRLVVLILEALKLPHVTVMVGMLGIAYMTTVRLNGAKRGIKAWGVFRIRLSIASRSSIAVTNIFVWCIV